MLTVSKIEMSELRKAMELAEGKRLHFPAFVSAADPHERTGRLLTRNILTDADEEDAVDLDYKLM